LPPELIASSMKLKHSSKCINRSVSGLSSTTLRNKAWLSSAWSLDKKAMKLIKELSK